VHDLLVVVHELGAGTWKPPLKERPGHAGLMVLDGLILREVRISRDWAGELLGKGDLLQPWVEDASSFVHSRWQVLEPARVAVLDSTFTSRLATYPFLIGELIERAIRRSRAIALHAIVEGVHRVEERLLLLLWYLAEQHGQRRNETAVVPIPLTHEQLGRLIGARRPTVTTALGKLEQQRQVSRSANGYWHLTGDPPQLGRA
jgi:hypothetical protein